MKKTLGLVFVILVMCGCTAAKKWITPGVAYKLPEEGYEKILNRKYEVIRPLILGFS